jgi:signal transduction histidine kinase
MNSARRREREERPADYLAALYRRHAQGALVRSVASIFMWTLCLFSYLLGIITVDNFTGISGSVVYLLVMSPATLWVLRHLHGVRLFEYCSLAINLMEVVGYTAIMHFLGGVHATYLLPIYCALITYLGVVGPRRLPFVVAVFCSVSFSVMVVAEHYGLLSNYNPTPPFPLPPWPNQLAIVGVSVCCLFVVAFIAAYTARLLRRNRDRLRQQNVELKLVAVKAQEGDRLKSEFLANMSHELRTPLNAIIGFSELLADRRLSGLAGPQQEYARDINASGRHLLAIINDLLDLTKVEAGKMELAVTDVGLPALLAESIAFFREEAARRRLDLTAAVAQCPETIRADERKLKQMFSNLLSNAVKFTPDGGRVSATARTIMNIEGRWFTGGGAPVTVPSSVPPAGLDCARAVEIIVADTGIGISRANFAKIFKPFEQVDGSIGRRYEGTGLGLSLTRRFAELHNGAIWVESEGENRGSAFHIVLPG